MLAVVGRRGALPGVFPPVEIDGRRYIDGGVTNRVPISVAVAAGATTAYVLDVGYPCECKRLSRSIVDIAMQATGIMGTQRLLADIDRYARADLELVHIPLPCHLAVRFTDFSHTEEMIRDAHRLTEQALETGPAGAAWLQQDSGPRLTDGLCRRRDQ